MFFDERKCGAFFGEMRIPTIHYSYISRVSSKKDPKRGDQHQSKVMNGPALVVLELQDCPSTSVAAGLLTVCSCVNPVDVPKMLSLVQN